MKKILSLTLLFLLLLSFLCVTGHAQSADDVINAQSASFTQTVSGFLSENSGTLLGMLTLLGSLIVAFLYKTGLLPMLRTGLSALKELLTQNSDVTERFTKDAQAVFRRIEEKTEKLPEMMEKTEDALKSMEERLRALEEELQKSEDDRKKTDEVLRTETELFYEMLASVNLPEAQKESMTESYYRMKKKLEAGV